MNTNKELWKVLHGIDFIKLYIDSLESIFLFLLLTQSVERL
jgi:hypothetical protein